MRELGQSARRLLARRGFTVTAVVTLGLAIGANTAIFSVLDAVALRGGQGHPGSRRASTCKYPAPVSTALRLRKSASSGRGSQICTSPNGKRMTSGSTPTTSVGRPSIRRRLPRMAVSPPQRCRQ